MDRIPRSVTDKPQARPFLAASPATPRTSLKRPRSSSSSSSSSIAYNSSSPTRQSTPSSSPQSNQSLVLENKDRSKRLRIDDTIIVGTQVVGDAEEIPESFDNVDNGDPEAENSLLDYILAKLEPIPKLQTVSELLQDEMDTISKNYRSQETRLKCLEEDLQKTTERNKLKIYGLHEDCILHDKHIKSLEGEQKTQSEILTKLEETFAKVETKLATLEKSVSKEISNSRIDRQCQSLNVSAGNPVSYDKLKARCRKLEERFTSLQQSTTTEERKHRLLEGNTKYTRQLNESVNSWKAQCDKEHSEAKLLKEQMQTLEKRSSAMEKTIRDQQRLIEELVSQLPRHSDKSRVSETPPKRFWQR